LIKDGISATQGLQKVAQKFMINISPFPEAINFSTSVIFHLGIPWQLAKKANAINTPVNNILFIGIKLRIKRALLNFHPLKNKHKAFG
jgi:hypothetical protein